MYRLSWWPHTFVFAEAIEVVVVSEVLCATMESVFGITSLRHTCVPGNPTKQEGEDAVPSISCTSVCGDWVPWNVYDNVRHRTIDLQIIWISKQKKKKSLSSGWVDNELSTIWMSRQITTYKSITSEQVVNELNMDLNHLD